MRQGLEGYPARLSLGALAGRRANVEHALTTHMPRCRHVHEALATCLAAKQLRGVRQGPEGRLAPQSLSTVAGREVTTKHTVITHMPRRRPI